MVTGLSGLPGHLVQQLVALASNIVLDCATILSHKMVGPGVLERVKKARNVADVPVVEVIPVCSWVVIIPSSL